MGELAEGVFSESRRGTEQVKLRLSPAAALRLRTAATQSGRTLSEFVVALLDERVAAGAADASFPPDRDALAEVSRLAHAIYSLAEEARLARGELGRSLGLVKHLFTISSEKAQVMREELSAAVLGLRDATKTADSTLLALHEHLASMRSELAAAAKRIARLG